MLKTRFGGAKLFFAKYKSINKIKEVVPGNSGAGTINFWTAREIDMPPPRPLLLAKFLKLMSCVSSEELRPRSSPQAVTS